MANGGRQRRAAILKLLTDSAQPITGTELSRRLGVSRQVIVQDIALLKTGSAPIEAGRWGYQLKKPEGVTALFPVRHDDDQIRDELYAIVDAGGRVEDVRVRHATYGELRVTLTVSSRREVDHFVENLQAGQSTPLTRLTKGRHFHTVTAESSEVLEAIANELKDLGILDGHWKLLD